MPDPPDDDKRDFYIDRVGASQDVASPRAKKAPRVSGALPARWNVGPRNPNYLDRDNLLARLHDALTSGTTAALTQAIAGLGGVGKSTLAREYAHAFASEYDIIWEIKAGTPATLIADLAALGREAKVAELGIQEPDAAKATLTWLRTQTRWLLVFDNAENAYSIRPWLPGNLGGHVIITSRNPHWRELGQSLEVRVFNAEGGAKFIATRSGISNEPAPARQLSEALGGLPLALDLAARFIYEKRITIAKYLTLLPEHHGRLLGPVAATFRISVEQLSPASLRLLQQLSFLGPDDVPESLLIEGDELEFIADARAGLIRYSLIEVRDGGIFTHRLLQAAVRAETPNPSAILESLAETMNAAFEYKEHDLATWAGATRLYPHVGILAVHVQATGSLNDSMGRLLNEAGLYALHMASDSAAALRLAKLSLEIVEKAHGPEHAEMAIRANNIGTILQAQGDLAGALGYAQRALAIHERACGPEHPTVAIDANNIGTILYAQGDLAGALKYARRALAIAEKVNGPGNTQVAIFANNVGMILSGQGDLAGALGYTRRALKINEELYGLEHPQVASDCTNIGAILKAQGDLDAALEHARRALAIGEKMNSPWHPNVAIFTNNIGQILKAQGDLTGALDYTRRALEIDEKVSGPEHPNVAIRADHIGQILHAQGDLPGALSYTRRPLAIFQKTYGPDNPSTRTVAQNLALLQQLQKAPEI